MAIENMTSLHSECVWDSSDRSVEHFIGKPSLEDTSLFISMSNQFQLSQEDYERLMNGEVLKFVTEPVTKPNGPKYRVWLE